ncbi:unnamed protein product [Lactuca saligna]|uniref:Uncharacterized protein n=1 Tax=Lactuca saligna TaxID=75948 RepID=A0AA35YW12_LACSI|nr:unnamed protein product [Lactuca saligna]
MYKYGSNGETDDMLEFDATFDSTQDSALLDLDDDFLCVPVGKEATKLFIFESLVARTMVPITYASWLEVSEEVSEGLWQYVLMQETGKMEEEIDRTLLRKKARELKTGGYESDVKIIVDKIDELQKSRSFGEVTCGTQNVPSEALGTQEQRGHVRGMGKFITPQHCFYLPNNVKYYLDIENERVDKRINKLEDDLEKLKRGVLNVSEAASCQVWVVIENVEKEPQDESLEKVVGKPVTPMKKHATPVKEGATPLK